MKKYIFINYFFFVLLLLSGNTFAGIDDIFSGIDPAEPNNGLEFEIALVKQEYFFFEPVTIFVRFRNTNDDAVAVILEGDKFSGINSKITWNSFLLDDNGYSQLINANQFENMFIIPGKGDVYFALPDKIFPIGKTKVSLEYKHSQDYNQSPIEGIKIWQGSVQSNDLIVTCLDKETLSPEEQKQVEDNIKRHIGLLASENEIIRNRAGNYLVIVPKYSIPFLKNNLKSRNSQLKISSIDTLKRIAEKALYEKGDYKKNISFLEDLLLTYDNEQEPYIKEKVVQALFFFQDVNSEKHDEIVKILLKAINEKDQNLRRRGAIVLLKISKKDGISIVIEKMSDETYFAEKGSASQMVFLNTLKEATGQDFGTSIEKWKKWWEKNKDKFTTKE